MKKKKSRELSITSAVICGIIGSIIISILLLLVVATLINNSYLEISAGRFVVILIHALSVFIGSVGAGKIAGEKWGTVCSAVGCGYLLLLVIISLLFLDGLHGQLLAGTIAIATGCGASMLLCAHKKASKRKKSVRRVR